MKEFLVGVYPWIKALHIVAVIFWMAGMAYLPRLFVYHADALIGSDKSETFKIMERRLLRGIINPAMIATLVLGGLMLWANPDLFKQGWFHAKLGLIILMLALHGVFSRWRKDFQNDTNKRSPGFYAFWNEGPPLLVVIIVILAVVKPF